MAARKAIYRVNFKADNPDNDLIDGDLTYFISGGKDYDFKAHADRIASNIPNVISNIAIDKVSPELIKFWNRNRI